jgi:hypothetical protein
MSEIREGAFECVEKEPAFVGPGDGWSLVSASG